MRLRTLNRLTQVSSAVVTTLLVGAGCHLQKTPAAKPAPVVHPTTTMTWAHRQATTLASTKPSTLQAIVPTTEATAVPATETVTAF